MKNTDLALCGGAILGAAHVGGLKAIDDLIKKGYKDLKKKL